MHANNFPVAARGAVALAALILLSGCAGYPYWGAWSKRPTDAQIAAALQKPVVQVQPVGK